MYRYFIEPFVNQALPTLEPALLGNCRRNRSGVKKFSFSYDRRLVEERAGTCD